MTPLVFVALTAAIAAGQSGSYPFVIKPVAGTLDTGNGGLATQALLKTPLAVVSEPNGGYAILDSDNFQVRRVSADGTITSVIPLGVFCNDMKVARDGTIYLTSASLVFKVPPKGEAVAVAGNGIGGFSGEGGQAANAALDFRTNGIVLDASGNVYFVDGQRVRQVTPAGVIRTVAGNGSSAGFNGDNQPAFGAQLNGPWGIALDTSGNLYIADRFNYRIRKVAAGTGVITTIAGTGSYGFPVNGLATASPLGFVEGVTVDAGGNVYATDIGTNTVVKIDSSGTLTLLAGASTFSYADGPGASTYLFQPAGIAVDTAGNVLFTEINSHRVRQIAGTTVRTVAGRIRYSGDGGAATAAVLNSPIDVAVDAIGNLYIADGVAYRVRKVATDGTISTVAGTGSPLVPAEGAQASGSAIPQNFTVAADARGNIFVGTQTQVFRISPTGLINLYAGTGSTGNAGDGGPAKGASFLFISGLAADAAGNLYIGDHANNRVRKIAAADGIVTAFAGTGTPGSNGDNGPATAAQMRGAFEMPLAIDARGNVYIGDGGNYKVRMVSPAGVITTVAGKGTTGDPKDGGGALTEPLNVPSGLATDSSGALYIATRNQLVHRVEGGTIRTISGGGTGAPMNDSWAAATRGFEARGMRTDSNGDLIVADRGGSVVRKLVMNSPRDISIVEGNTQTAPVQTALPKALKVQVTGRAGLGVPDLPVSFAVTNGTATLSAASAVSDATGAASVSVTLGDAAGPVEITATAANLPAVKFTATATVTLTFNYLIGDPPPDPQLITVSDATKATAAVDGDVAWLVAEIADGGVKVSVTNLDMLSAGTYLGTVTIDSPTVPMVVPVLLTVI